MSCGIDIYDNLVYLLIRTGFWVGLLLLAGFDFLHHRGEKVYGWQLYAAVFFVISTIVLKDASSLMFRFFYDSSFFCYLLILFFDLVYASFIGLLMLISYGWKITHDRLGEGALSVKIGPVVFFASSIVHDIIIQHETQGSRYLNVSSLPTWEVNLLMISSLLYIFTVVYMLFWVFETVQMEKIVLEEKICKSLTKSREPGKDADEVEIGGAYRPNPTRSSTGPNGEIKMMNFNEIERDHEQSDDENQFIPNTAKLTLLTRFFYAVINYFIAICLIKIIVIWNFGIVTTAVLIYHDIVFYVFVAVLAYIFRLREHSPYFMVGAQDNVDDIMHEINVDTIERDDDSDSSHDDAFFTNEGEVGIIQMSSVQNTNIMNNNSNFQVSSSDDNEDHIGFNGVDHDDDFDLDDNLDKNQL